MSEKQELKPTDTAKLLEWLGDGISHYEEQMDEQARTVDYCSAQNSRMQLSAFRQIEHEIGTGKFALDETPSAPDTLQVLAGIWDRWKAHLLDNEFIWDHRQEMPHVVYDITYAHSYRHNMATQLALAVHMEIDGTVGVLHTITGNHRLCIAKGGTLYTTLEPDSVPTYLNYKTEEDAQRACELLQPIAKELFFVFEDATPKQGEEE